MQLPEVGPVFCRHDPARRIPQAKGNVCGMSVRRSPDCRVPAAYFFLRMVWKIFSLLSFFVQKNQS